MARRATGSGAPEGVCRFGPYTTSTNSIVNIYHIYNFYWLCGSVPAYPFSQGGNCLDLYFSISFWYPFFDIVFVLLVCPFWCQLCSNLASNLVPKSTQHRPKSHPKSIQNLILFLMPSWIDFWWIFGPTCRPKSLQNPSKTQSRGFPTS